MHNSIMQPASSHIMDTYNINEAVNMVYQDIVHENWQIMEQPNYRKANKR